MGKYNLLLVLLLCMYRKCGEAYDNPLTSIPTNIHDFNKAERVYLELKQNYFRRIIEASDMMYMKWDKQLARRARREVSRCNIELIDTQFPVNIYTGINGSVYSILKNWTNPILIFEEMKKPAKERNPCVSLGYTCEHVQILVSDSTKFGCSRKLCGKENDQSYIVVCQYEHKYDNWRMPYRITTRCTECGGKGAKCHKIFDLCLSKEQCDGRFRGECVCKQECVGSILDETLCECVCPLCSDLRARAFMSRSHSYLPNIGNIILIGTLLLFVDIHILSPGK